MAQLRPGFLAFTSLVLLSVGSLVFPTSSSTTTILSEHIDAADRVALISFKSMISNDPTRLLVSWNDSIHFCRWPGVTCGSYRHPQRVISVNLSSLSLSGSISPAITNLTFLRKTDLSNNYFHGTIPQEIGRLFRLQHLDVSMNSLVGGVPATLSSCSQLQNLIMHDNMLTGEIPSNIGFCVDLQKIDLSNNSLTGHIPSLLGNLSSLFFLNFAYNEFIGEIPPSLANLSSLSILDLSTNKLSGSIPPTIGNLLSLTVLFLDYNQLSRGIPPSLGKLSNLKQLYLSSNNLTGVIPPSLWNISRLSHLIMPYNYLSGSLPPNVDQAFPLLEVIHLSGNQFHGPIPMSLSNASRLEHIELSENRFSSAIPVNLGALQNLQFLGLTQNHLDVAGPDGWSFLTSLTNCTRLELLQLDMNNLGGVLPDSVANLSTKLQVLSMSSNFISGEMSRDIGNLVNLSEFYMDANMLSGSIPPSIGMLRNLHRLHLSNNKLSGGIPSTLGNLTLLNSLLLHFNELSGNIPQSLGNCQSLELLHLRSNKLTGNIPKEVLTISRISIGLSLASNELTGLIPSEIGSLRNLGVIDFSENKLSGEIPSTLSECQVLEELYLGGNFLRGSIPSSFSSLNGIKMLDVSRNNLSGKIPDFFQHFRALLYLNLSFNNFEGQVPRLGVFNNKSAISVIGNNNLCGGNPALHLPACPSQSPKQQHISRLWIAIISIASSFVFLSVLFCLFFLKRKSRKPLNCTSMKEQYVKVSYADLVRATNGFSTDNLIGSGSFSTVYKGLVDGASMQAVAVKVLNLELQGASKSFISECEALRNIRHRNLVKIVTVCSSIDFRGNDFKAVVFEFMDNGSLDDWLHPNESEQHELKKLSLIQRVNIAIDVASALHYLHHHGETPIIHCDMKPSNILLNSNMIAHVGDFGLAKFLKETITKASENSTSSFGLKGTVGYIAPEYGVANKASIHGDVYSYGILLLEMFTARRPTDDMFKGGQSLRKFVESAFPDGIMDVMDAHLLVEVYGEASDNGHNINCCRTMGCVASMFRIGLLCSSELPTDRMDTGIVINELHEIRDAFTRHETKEESRSRFTEA